MTQNKFEVGDCVRKKPRGHKMIVQFVYSPDCTGLYLAAYQAMKLQNPTVDYFYACANAKTGKPIDGVFVENILEEVMI